MLNTRWMRHAPSTLVAGTLATLFTLHTSRAQDVPEVNSILPSRPVSGTVADDGAFRYEIPIELPAFHGVEPRLSIGYHSRRGDGLLGIGWSVDGFSMIERASPGGGAPRYADPDSPSGAARSLPTSVYLLDGQALVPCEMHTDVDVNGRSKSPSCANYGTHTTKEESFFRITLDRVDPALNDDDIWRVTAPDGTVSEYHAIYSPRPGGGVFRWGIDSVTDSNGNVTHYDWTCDRTTCRPSKLSYNGVVVSFRYEHKRLDPKVYANGWEIMEEQYRLDHIDVCVGSPLPATECLTDGTSDPRRARTYLFNYMFSDFGEPLLNGVTLFGRGTTIRQYTEDANGWTEWIINGTVALRLGKFKYSNPGGETFRQTSNAAWPAPTSVWFDAGGRRHENKGLGFFGHYYDTFSAGDFDGDGRSELLQRAYRYSPWQDPRIDDYILSFKDGSRTKWHAEVHVPTGLVGNRLTCFKYTLVHLKDEPLSYDQERAEEHRANEISRLEHRLGDFDGDGKTDFAISAPGSGDCSIQVFRSTGVSFSAAEWSRSRDELIDKVVDLNGDGKDDLLAYSFLGAEPGCMRLEALISTGHSFVTRALPSICPRGEISPLSADFNGDGRADFIVLRYRKEGSDFDVTPDFYLTSFDDRTGALEASRFQSDTLAHSAYGWYYDPDGNGVVDDIDGFRCPFASEGHYDSLTKVADWNGDGKSDIQVMVDPCVHHAPRPSEEYCEAQGLSDRDCHWQWLRPAGKAHWGNFWIHLSTGNSFARGEIWGKFQDIDFSESSLGDFDGNGLVDLFRHTGHVLYGLGSGLRGFIGTRAVDGPISALSDFNGDGSTDVVKYTYGWKLFTSTLGPRLLIEAQTMLGGSYEISYTPSSEYSTSNNPPVFQVVSQVTSDDGRGGISSVNYSYHDGLYQRPSREFIGWYYITKTLPLIAPYETKRPYERTYYFRNLGSVLPSPTSVEPFAYRLDYFFSRPYAVERYDGDDTIQTRDNLAWNLNFRIPLRATGTRLVGASRTVLQDLDYSNRDSEGRLLGITSAHPNEGWNFSYDGLHQLTEATNTDSATYSMQLRFDPIGNLEYNSALFPTAPCVSAGSNYCYPAAGAARPHAATTAGHWSAQYDPAGNMERRQTLPVAFNVSGGINSVGREVNRYNARGDRNTRKNTSSGLTTYFIGDDYEVDATTGVVTKYVSIGPRLVAKRAGIPRQADGTGGESTYWIHGDHQGSVRVITNGSGAEVQRLTYNVLGATMSRSTSHGETRGYSGQTTEPQGLLYLHARFYDPAVGRFLSPDPIISNSRLVGLNRYAYAANDPVNNTDTSGYQAVATVCVTVGGGSCSGSGSDDGAGGFGGAGGGWEWSYGWGGGDDSGTNRDPTFVSPSRPAPQPRPMPPTFHYPEPPLAKIFADLPPQSYAESIDRVLGGEIVKGVANFIYTIYAELLGFYDPTPEGFVSAIAPPITLKQLGEVGGGAVLKPPPAGAAETLGETIARGHAFEKHVLKRGEFAGLGIRTRAQFGRFIDDIVGRGEVRHLEGGRTAWWDERTGTIVIRSPGEGTAFQPELGKSYFTEVIK